MGGSGGESVISPDMFKAASDIARKELQKANDGSSDRKNIFISFAYEDNDEVNLLRGQAKNDKSDLEFNDHSVKDAYDSKNADYIKRQITEKIRRASVTIVYLTEHSAKSKWVSWEIEQSVKLGKGVIGVYKGDRAPTSVPEAFKSGGHEIVPWKHKELSDAIDRAAKKRSP